MSFPNEMDIRKALTGVIDPELHLDILNLGLIYTVEPKPEEKHIRVEMTLTSPACPYGPELQRQTHDAVATLPEVKTVHVEIVFSPPWDPRTMASDDAKDILGIF